MKSWIRQVRALTATMIELRRDRALWERRRWELGAGIAEGTASFLHASGLSRAEILDLQIPAGATVDARALRQAQAEIERIDDVLLALEQKVRNIAASAGAEEMEAPAPAEPPAAVAAANVVPFRRPVQPRPEETASAGAA